MDPVSIWVAVSGLCCLICLFGFPMTIDNHRKWAWAFGFLGSLSFVTLTIAVAIHPERLIKDWGYNATNTMLGYALICSLVGIVICLVYAARWAWRCFISPKAQCPAKISRA